MMQTVNLSLDLVNKVLAYFGSLPYSEVFPLVEAIRNEAEPQLAPQPESAPVEEKPETE